MTPENLEGVGKVKNRNVEFIQKYVCRHVKSGNVAHDRCGYFYYLNRLNEVNLLILTLFLCIGYLDQSDAFLVYDGLMFCASRNTDRIHLYTKVKLK